MINFQAWLNINNGSLSEERDRSSLQLVLSFKVLILFKCQLCSRYCVWKWRLKQKGKEKRKKKDSKVLMSQRRRKTTEETITARCYKAVSGASLGSVRAQRWAPVSESSNTERSLARPTCTKGLLWKYGWQHPIWSVDQAKLYVGPNSCILSCRGFLSMQWSVVTKLLLSLIRLPANTQSS